jgi:hypothetical protein
MVGPLLSNLPGLYPETSGKKLVESVPWRGSLLVLIPECMGQPGLKLNYFGMVDVAPTDQLIVHSWGQMLEERNIIIKISGNMQSEHLID